MCIAGDVKERNAFVLVGFIGVLVPVDFPLAAVLFFAPLVRHFFIEGGVHQSVELIDIHCVDPVLKALVFSLMALDYFLVLAPFVGMAGVQRIAHPYQNLVVEAKPPKEVSELRFERFLAHMLAAARGRIALALIGVAGAVIIDVALLLDLSDNSAAACMAGDQAREGEVMFAALGLLGEASVEHALHPFP